MTADPPLSSPVSPFEAPALIARRGRSSLLTPDGELLTDLTVEATLTHLKTFPPPLLVHGPATLRALGQTRPGQPQPEQPAPWFDLLELFLFVCPARTVAPTPRGLALALGVTPDDSLTADILPRLAHILLDRLEAIAETEEVEILRALLAPLSHAGWRWSGIVEQIIGTPDTADSPCHDGLRVWWRLPKWEDTAPRPPPASYPVGPRMARERLRQILGHRAEIRPGQADFASAVTGAFEPREAKGAPNVILAEAGTGTGKTLGYIAPASLWAERNDGPVWISTYTRHLQRQIEQELHHLYPDETQRRQKVVLRKGRENYLCLLNMEETLNTALSRAAVSPERSRGLIPLGLLARWADKTQDGDLMGGDLPGWFGELFGQGTLHNVADRRGECIHAACTHYQTCFVEHGIRRARQADLVVANHALVMAQAAWAAMAPDNVPDEDGTPTRYIFDEGHHVPDAADSAFAIVFSGLETAELRRWLLGAEGRRSRARGLLRRMDDLVEHGTTIRAALQDVLDAAHALAAPGWSERLAPRPHKTARPDTPSSPEQSPVEEFSTEQGAGDLPTDGLQAEASVFSTPDATATTEPPDTEASAEGASAAKKSDTRAPGMNVPVKATPDRTAPFRVVPDRARADRARPDATMPDMGTDNPTEQFLKALDGQLRARQNQQKQAGSPYRSAECDLFPIDPLVLDTAGHLRKALHRLQRPLARLATELTAHIDSTPEIDAATRQRIEAMIRVLHRRAIARVTGWISMLDALAGPEKPEQAPGQYVDFIRSEPLPGHRAEKGQIKGQHDIGLCRHWLDPTIPFAATIQTTAHGLLLTSATLRDQSGTTQDRNDTQDWQAAEIRLGATHFIKPPIRASVLSPFDYARQTRTYIITDVAADPASLAWAFQSLFEASGGGGLGLFTAIKRLREVHHRIHERLETQGIPLYAQHVDAMDNATLVDIFRTEAQSCLLGTDAMRDGVDVPGDALRLVVLEKTPWPRPDILHRERRRALSNGPPGDYDDQLTRMKLRQAFGRLIRHETDRGVFVILDRRMPSRLLSAFPEGVTVNRLGLADALLDIRAFFSPSTPDAPAPSQP